MPLPYDTRPATQTDIDQLREIESEAFPTNWPPTPFKRDLGRDKISVLVAYDTTQHPDPTPNPAPLPRSFNPSRTLLGFLRHLIGMEPSDSNVTASNYVAGYVITGFMTDEAHILGIAVRGRLRGKGIGELLLISSIEMAIKNQSRVSTLEVRVSNHVAQSLYTKYGFKQVGERKGYYTDNHENAYIMTTDEIGSAPYMKRFRELADRYKSDAGDISLTIE